MKKTRKLLSLLLTLLLVVFTVALISSCGEDTDPAGSTGSSTVPSTTPSSTAPSSTTPSSRPDPTPSSTPSSRPDDGGDTQRIEYTVRVYDENTNKPISNVYVFLFSEADRDSDMGGFGRTGEDGVARIFAPADKAKYVYVEGLPTGYVYNEYTAMGTTGADVKAHTALIPNEGSLANKPLSLGSIMYDLTLSTFVFDPATGEFTDKEIKLSDLFANGKKAIMLNFWYTTCTYCIEEFPYIQSAYEKYGDEIEIIGINAYDSDNVKKMKDFVVSFNKPGSYTQEGCALTFPMVYDVMNIQDAFGFTVNPCTVIIDRYGVVSMVQTGGVLGERYFTNAFAHYVSKDYEQELFSSIYDLSPMIKPDVDMSPENEIKDATVNGDINISFRPEEEGEDAEYSWPFIVYDKDGEQCIASTNVDIDNSFAILYVDVELKAGQGIMFDYYCSTQSLYDVLYILVDGKDIYAISGKPLPGETNPWQGCCPWVATEDGTYEVAFCYIKDESEYEGDDRVYLDNFRVVDEDDIDVESYIPRYAATDMKDDGTFGSYVDVVLNENDGYYHVGTADGPILMAGLLGVNTQFSLKLPEEMRTTVTDVISAAGEFIVNGVDKYNALIMYCNYASNSRLYGYCPVTVELRGYLEEYVRQNDFFSDENTWLQLCTYYNTYGTDEQLEDPIKGLTSFSAYDAVVTPQGEEGFRNTVTYTQIIMPRGLLFKFVPTESGVYRITSNSSQEVSGWVFTGNFEKWVNENGGDRILYLHSETGERHCPELLIDPDGDGTYERDFKNCSMIGYFEAGVEYYIDIAYYDVYGTGTFTFDLKYVGESFNKFEEASPGYFTYEEGIGDIIATGIDVKLCEDESDPRYGYYCHLLPNGELGSIVYADFHFTTNIFQTESLESLIEKGRFNMGMTETDHEAYVYFKNYYEKDGINALKKLWGEEFDANWELYQMTDIINGIYHGTGPDYTEAMRAYLDKLEDGTDGTGSEIIYPERQGCVPVDRELATMLQAIMDKFTFADVDHSWTKLCYYYNTLEAPASISDMLSELNEMVSGAEIESDEIAAQVQAIYSSALAEVEKWSIDSVKRDIINSAMASIYALIETDKAQK